jgi:hypothetical protein
MGSVFAPKRPSFAATVAVRDDIVSSDAVPCRRWSRTILATRPRLRRPVRTFWGAPGGRATTRSQMMSRR